MAKPNLEVYIGADIDGFNKGLKEVEGKSERLRDSLGRFTKQTDNLSKSANDAGKSFNGLSGQTDNFGSAMNKVGGVIAGAFALDALIGFGKQVVDITAEFQKFEAVLTNTLGSKSAAQRSMAMLVDFAAKTPYSVAELTGSFVKLANMGFKPTADEMRKLGDLAASTGKTFDMLTEAIIDAQTGEFERLKEFGIRASKEGDNVTFAFKGVQTQTEFTSKSIRDYVLSLGDAVGVSGAMEAISQTLGGRISNLGDSWDTLLKTLGEDTQGIMATTISLLDKAIKKANELLKSDKQVRNDEGLEVANQQVAMVDELIKKEKDLKKVRTQAYANVEKELKDLSNQIDSMDRQRAEILKTAQSRNLSEGERGVLSNMPAKREDAVNRYNDLLNNGRTAIREHIEELEILQEKELKAQEEADKKKYDLAKKAWEDRQDLLEKEIEFKRQLLEAEPKISPTDIYKDSDIGKSASTGKSGLDIDFNQMDSDIGIDWTGYGEQATAYYDKIAEGELKSAMAMQKTADVMQGQMDLALMITNQFEEMFNSLFDDLANGEFTWKKFGQTVLATIGKLITKTIAYAITQAIAAEAPKGVLGIATAAIASAGFASLFAAIPKFADGGIVSGETMGIMGEYQGAKTNPEVIAPLSKLSSLMKGMGGSNVMVNGEFRVNGRDLVVVLQNENRFTNRTN